MPTHTEHHRRSIRLKGYDYTQPVAYFVTIVVQGHESRLGTVLDAVMLLNLAGNIVQAAWEDLPRQYPHGVFGGNLYHAQPCAWDYHFDRG